jgi:SRSO17 transposase
MDRRFEVRKQQILAECVLDHRVVSGMLNRLGQFILPFAEHLLAGEQRAHASTYIQGLLSDLKRKSAEGIAYDHDQARQNVQHFLGRSAWDHRPLLRELVSQLGREIGCADGVIVFDPSAFPKQGQKSVGVARQWCGRLGKVENCQVGVYLGYVSREERALADMRLYLPEAWAKDRKRRRQVGVPKQVRFQTRHELALEMLDEHGNQLPHGWVAGDDEMGRNGHFRRDLQGRNECYLLAIASNTTLRDLRAPPAYGPSGRRLKPRQQQVQKWSAALPEEAWTLIDVRDGEKGPLRAEMAIAQAVEAKTDRRWMRFAETLVVVRTHGADGAVKYDYHLSNAPPQTPLAEFARVFCAMHRIEECLKRAKSEAALADYAVRTWPGWHHHQTLSLIATWFLIRETRRGKKIHPSDYSSFGSPHPGLASPRLADALYSGPNPPLPRPSDFPQRAGSCLSLQCT